MSGMVYGGDGVVKRCSACGEPIAFSDKIKHVGTGQVVHEECADSLGRSTNTQAEQVSFPEVGASVPKGEYFSRKPRLDIVFYTEGLSFDPTVLMQTGLGGSESSAYLLCKGLAQRGHKVRLFCSTENPGMYEGVEYISGTKIADLKEQPDVLIVSRFIDAYRLQNLDAKCNILWMHDILAGDWAKRLLSVLYKIDLVAVNSEWAHEQATMDYALGSTPERTFFVCRNPIDYTMIRQCTAGVERNPNRIMYTSRPERGLVVLLQAWKRLKSAWPALELYICSYENPHLTDDPRQQAVEKEVAELLKELEGRDIYLLPSLPKDKLYEELAKTTLLVYPSIFPETSCISALEAMACGAVPVCAAFAALTETIPHREAGWLIKGQPRVPRMAGKDLGFWYSEPHTHFQMEMTEVVCRLLRNPVEWDRLRIGGMMRVQWYDYKLVAAEWEAKMLTTLDRVDHAQKVTAGIILRDDEDDALRMLHSIQSEVDEIRIFVDSRSTDETWNIVKKYQRLVNTERKRFCRVLTLHWKEDSFAWARNRSLKGVRTPWFLWIDGDETLEGGIRRYLRYNSFNGYNMQQVHMTPVEIRTDLPVRLFRTGIGVQFFGRIHEQPELVYNESVQKSILIPDVKILHDGYARGRSVIDNRWWRNHAYLESDLQENPDRDITVHNVMRDIIFYVDKTLEANGGTITDECLKLLTKLTDQLWPRFDDSSNIWYPHAMRYYQRALEVLDYPLFIVGLGGSHQPLDENVLPPIVRMRFRSAEDLKKFVLQSCDQILKGLYPQEMFPHPQR